MEFTTTQGNQFINVKMGYLEYLYFVEMLEKISEIGGWNLDSQMFQINSILKDYVKKEPKSEDKCFESLADINKMLLFFAKYTHFSTINHLASRDFDEKHESELWDIKSVIANQAN